MSDIATSASIRRTPPASYRWLVLLVVALAMFANYYVFDAMNPVGPLLESQLGFTQSQIGLLDSAYNIAALLILLFGGVFIDRAGTKRAMVLFSIVTAVGGALIAVGGRPEVMAAGRFVLGLGAEPLIVAVTAVLARWFRAKELSFAMAIDLTIARLGSVAADNSRTWAGSLFDSWQRPLVLAAFVGGLCVASALLYVVLERRAEATYELGRASGADRLVLADLVRFPRGYWYVVGLCVTFYSAVFPFRRFANIFFVQAHGASETHAAFLNGVLPLTAMIATPLFGLLADRIGRRSTLMAVGSLVLLPTFLLMAYTRLPLAVPVAMIGVAFSLIPAVMWPSVAYLVEESRLGTAYALMTLCQQIGWATMSWAIGFLNDRFGAGPANPAGFNPGMWLFASLGILGLVFSFLLWRCERGPGAHGLETITTRG
ncbi:MAG: MFS transporter [Acidobacteriota bacterium]